MEARQPQEEPNEQLAADLDLDAWEEEHAIEVRPRKRARKGVTVPMAERPILADAVQPSWAFAHLCFFHTLDESELAADAPETQLNNFFGAVSGASVTFTPTDQPGCHLQATAPSEEAADAFIHLLRNNYLVLGPFSSAPPSSQPYVQCEASSSQSSSFWTTVGLAERALADNAAYPDDKKRRLMNAQLLAVLRWLLPDAGLDPDAEDLPLDAPEDIANSPLCSPKKAGNEGHAAHLPGSPTARNTDAGHAVTFDAAELYRAVKPSGQEAQLQRALPHLKPTLRSYQRRAAQWMLDREQSGAKTETGSESSLHPLWRRVPLVGRGQGPRGRGKRDCGATDDDNKCFFVNPYSGLLSLDEYPVPPPPKGEFVTLLCFP